MDYGQRLATVEADVNSIQEQLRDIKAEQIRLRNGLEKLREYTEQGFANTRQEFSNSRDRTDQGFAEIRAMLDEIRKEQSKNLRWIISLGITYGTAIVGMMAKMAGMF